MNHFARGGMRWRLLASLATQLHNAASLSSNQPTCFVSFDSGKPSSDFQRNRENIYRFSAPPTMSQCKICNGKPMAYKAMSSKPLLICNKIVEEFN